MNVFNSIYNSMFLLKTLQTLTLHAYETTKGVKDFRPFHIWTQRHAHFPIFKAHAVKVAFISIYGLKHTPILTSAYYNNTKHMLILCVCVYSLFSSCVVVPVHCVVGVV